MKASITNQNTMLQVPFKKKILNKPMYRSTKSLAISIYRLVRAARARHVLVVEKKYYSN